MDDLQLSDPTAQRVARFCADLMLTLAEDGVAGAACAEALSELWHGAGGQVRPAHDGLDVATAVHGLGAVAAALAGQLALERRATGRTGATPAEVWHEVGRALDSVTPYDTARANRTVPNT